MIVLNILKKLGVLKRDGVLEKLGFFEGMGLPAEPLIGLDITSSSIKLLQLGLINERYVVKQYGSETLPQGAVLEKQIKDPEAVGLCIKKLIDRLGIKDRAVVISISDSASVTKTIQVKSDLTDKEIQDEIEIEAEKYIPFPIEDVSIDFYVIGISASNPAMKDVMVAAAKFENIDTKIEALAYAGLIAKVVDIDAFAMERAFSLIAPQLPNSAIGQVVALIDIGSNVTVVYVLDNLRVVYSHEHVFGGDQLVHEIEQRYGLTHQEAMSSLKDGTLPDDFISDVLNPFKKIIAQEVSRDLQFFYSAGEYNDINYIVLSGGTSIIPGLPQVITEKTGKRAFIPNPFADMVIEKTVDRLSLEMDAHRLMICCGLALRNFIR